MRFIGKKTKVRMLVNMEVSGMFGKCLNSFNEKARKLAIDELIEDGLLDKDYHVTNDGKSIVSLNLDKAENKVHSFLYELEQESKMRHELQHANDW